LNNGSCELERWIIFDTTKMIRTEFKSKYKYAEKTQIKSDVFFNAAGYFWMRLTQIQLNKMIDLMIIQGVNQDSEGWVSLENGMRFKKG